MRRRGHREVERHREVGTAARGHLARVRDRVRVRVRFGTAARGHLVRVRDRVRVRVRVRVCTAAGGHLLQLPLRRREVGAAERGVEARVVEGHLVRVRVRVRVRVKGEGEG